MRTIQALTRGEAVAALEQEALPVQKAGGIVAFIDLRRELDIAVCRQLGVSPEELLVSQPDDERQGREIAGHLEKTGVVDLLIFA